MYSPVDWHAGATLQLPDILEGWPLMVKHRLFTSLASSEMNRGKLEKKKKERAKSSARCVSPVKQLMHPSCFKTPQEPLFILSISTANGNSTQHEQHPSQPQGRHIIPPVSPPLGQWTLRFPYPPWQFADVKLHSEGPIKCKRSQTRI